VEHLKGATFGLAMALPTYIRLVWRGLPGTNAVAYLKKLSIKAVKSFTTLAQVSLIGIIMIF
jgi:hypothetical protein